MQSDSDQFLHLVVAVLQDWWVHLGAFAWVILGLLLVGAILLCVWALRFVLGGGITRLRPRSDAKSKPPDEPKR